MSDEATPLTVAGRALLEREAFNSRSFAIIRVEDILAIEQEARQHAPSEGPCHCGHGWSGLHRCTESECGHDQPAPSEGLTYGALRRNLDAAQVPILQRDGPSSGGLQAVAQTAVERYFDAEDPDDNAATLVAMKALRAALARQEDRQPAPSGEPCHCGHGWSGLHRCTESECGHDQPAPSEGLDVERLARAMEHACIPWVGAPLDDYRRLADTIVRSDAALARQEATDAQ